MLENYYNLVKILKHLEGQMMTKLIQDELLMLS